MKDYQIMILAMLVILIIANYFKRKQIDKRIELLKDLPESKIIAMSKYEKHAKTF